ncbi:MAG TPA: MBL fold metallo-hydrolase [Candidatus Binatia bacterium]|nr:MBL fold metallo-hydrolase [Candidatus Binatia bacterium]
MRLLLAAVLALLTAAGCTGPASALRPFDGLWAPPCAPGASPIELQYLGAGGILMRRGDHAIMTAPFYSNPGLVEVGLGLPIRANVERIEKLLPRGVDGVDAILVGHAHYDHLMDAVHVAEARATHATVYGNDAALHILASRPALWGRVQSVEDGAGDWTRPGRWYYVAENTIRFMPLRSEHAPHFLGIQLFRGGVDAVRRKLPQTAYGWRGGQTLAFLIDFLAPDGTVDLRIHYQDAATNPPAGFPPPEEPPTPVDVAVLCVASFGEVRGYPEAILARTRPRVILLGHWENFFSPPEEHPCPVPLTNTRAFARRLEAAAPGTEWRAANPKAVLRVCPRR